MGWSPQSLDLKVQAPQYKPSQNQATATATGQWTGTSTPAQCGLRRGASQSWAPLSKTQTQAGVLSLLYPDREIFDLRVNLCHSLSPVITDTSSGPWQKSWRRRTGEMIAPLALPLLNPYLAQQ